MIIRPNPDVLKRIPVYSALGMLEYGTTISSYYNRKRVIVDYGGSVMRPMVKLSPEGVILDEFLKKVEIALNLPSGFIKWAGSQPKKNKKNPLAHIPALRQAICYHAKTTHPKLYLTVIGAALNIDHTSVLYSLKSAKRYIEVDDTTFMSYYNIIKEIPVGL